MRCSALLRMTTANGGQKIVVANAKIKLVLSESCNIPSVKTEFATNITLSVSACFSRHPIIANTHSTKRLLSSCPPLRHPPHLHCLVTAPRDDAPATRRPGYRVHNTGMACVGKHMPALGSVPHLHRLVTAPRGDAPAIRRPVHRIDSTGVTRVGEHMLTCPNCGRNRLDGRPLTLSRRHPWDVLQGVLHHRHAHRSLAGI